MEKIFDLTHLIKFMIGTGIKTKKNSSQFYENDGTCILQTIFEEDYSFNHGYDKMFISHVIETNEWKICFKMHIKQMQNISLQNDSLFLKNADIINSYFEGSLSYFNTDMVYLKLINNSSINLPEYVRTKFKLKLRNPTQ